MDYSKKVLAIVFTALLVWVSSAAASSYISRTGEIKLTGVTLKVHQTKVLNIYRNPKTGKVVPTSWSWTEYKLKAHKGYELILGHIELNGKKYTPKVQGSGADKVLAGKISKRTPPRFTLVYQVKKGKKIHHVERILTFQGILTPSRQGKSKIKVLPQVEVNLSIDKDTPSFDQTAVRIALYSYHPFKADVKADLVGENIIRNFSHTKGKKTERTLTVSLAKSSRGKGKKPSPTFEIHSQLVYYVTVQGYKFNTVAGEWNFFNGQGSGRGTTKVLTKGHPQSVDMTARFVRQHKLGEKPTTPRTHNCSIPALSHPMMRISLTAKIIVEGDQYALDLHGKKSLQELAKWLKEMDKNHRARNFNGHFPAVQPIKIFLEIANHGQKVEKITLGGDRYGMSVKGDGPAFVTVTTRHIFRKNIRRGHKIILKPGEKKRIALSLRSGYRSSKSSYFTAPGVYRLQFHYSFGRRGRTVEIISPEIRVEVTKASKNSGGEKK